jgi:Zn-dependent protease with chaperone function
MALSVALAVWGLPWAAHKVAQRLPQEWVVQLGKGTLTGLDKALGTPPPCLHLGNRRCRRVCPVGATGAIPATLIFRDWPRVGPNALALPDGTIVMTDQLVALAEDDRELLAVLAHELGHVQERHALQKVLASSGVAALVFMLTGDVSGLASIVVAAPTIMTHLHHSRASGGGCRSLWI